MRRREIREVVPTGHDRAVGHEARPQSAASLSALAQSGWSVDCSSPGHKVGAVRRLSGYSVSTRYRYDGRRAIEATPLTSQGGGRERDRRARLPPGTSIVRFTIRGNN